MERTAGALCGALLMLTTLGCGQANSKSGASAAHASAEPDQIVAYFLEAVRTGDNVTAAKLLTPLARQKAAEMNMVVAPPGSDTATYKVVQVERVADNEVHVESQWSDMDETGKRRTDPIVWMLRQESEGWRIAGMATKMLDGKNPIVLNFEDPAAMLNTQSQAEQQMEQRAKEQALQAKQGQQDNPKSQKR